MRRIIPVLMLTLLPIVHASSADAAETGYHGVPLPDAPRLVPTTYGTVSHTDVSTTPLNNKNSTDPDCSENAQYTEGAAVYKVPAAIAGARIALTVTESADAQQLCKVQLFRSAGGAFTDLYDAAQRNSYRVASSDCPLTTAPLSSCKIAWTLTQTDTYYVVFWPAGDGAPDNFATFSAVTSVLQETATTLGISGYFGRNGSCYRVEAGKSFIARGRVAPTDATGMIRFTIRKRDESGTYNIVGEYNRTISSGTAAQSFHPSFGRYSVRATYLGSLEHAASNSEARCVHVVAHTVVTQKITGYYSTSADYYVFHSGDTITVVAKVGPTPITGRVRFRIDRENSDTTYSYIKSYTRSIVDGKATLTFSLGYSAVVVPFYRIRSEYLGDDLHFAHNSAYHCLWIKR